MCKDVNTDPKDFIIASRDIELQEVYEKLSKTKDELEKSNAKIKKLKKKIKKLKAEYVEKTYPLPLPLKVQMSRTS